ncbi:MAG: hypothetical protein KDG50_03165 [Chromatiales bacterium]|nr:hypothetical protein [Chromatiales bacterium]
MREQLSTQELEERRFRMVSKTPDLFEILAAGRRAGVFVRSLKRGTSFQNVRFLRGHLPGGYL